MSSGAVTSGAVIGLRPYGVAEVLDNAVRLVRRNASAAFALAAPFAVVVTVLAAAVQLATYDAHSASTLQFLWVLFVGGLIGPILTGLLAPVFVGDVLGRRVGVQATMARAGRRLPALIGLGIVVSVPQEIGLLLLVVGGVWLWGIWAVAAPALVVEGQGVFAALGRSFQLTKAAFWRTWGIRALGWLVVSVLSFFVSLPFQLLAAYLVDFNPLTPTGQTLHQPGLYVTVLAIGRVLATVVTAPISAAIDTLLYLDLRMRREGMDLVVAMSDARPQPAAPPSGAVTAW